MKAMRQKGFTLIELLVVVAIIGLLATVSVMAFANVQKKTRDTKRLADMKTIRNALELYRNEYGQYPDAIDNDDGCGGWDVGYLGSMASDDFMGQLTGAKVIGRVPGDPKGNTCTTAYLYYRYPAGYAGCDPARGAFYVLVATSFEASSSPVPSSPGWSCPSRDWGAANGTYAGLTAAWVAGQFEN
jgi:type II secretion system protein G